MPLAIAFGFIPFALRFYLQHRRDFVRLSLCNSNALYPILFQKMKSSLLD